MSKLAQKKLRDLRIAIEEDTRYFEQYKDHFVFLFGEDRMPEEFLDWEEKYEKCLKVLFLEDPKFGMKEYSYKQYSLAAFTIANFKRYQMKLNEEINLLTI